MSPTPSPSPHQDTLRECPPDHSVSGVPGGVAGGAQGVAGVDYACNPSLQFISPLYFVSFVLTAQFVLINVVVAVLMKHLDDSNKEAKEEAEMDAEIELELAQGTLCCMGAPGCGGGGGGGGANPPPEKVCAGGKERGGGGGGAPGRRDDRGAGARKTARHRGNQGTAAAAPTQRGTLGSSHSSQRQYSPAQVSRGLSGGEGEGGGHVCVYTCECLCLCEGVSQSVRPCPDSPPSPRFEP